MLDGLGSRRKTGVCTGVKRSGRWSKSALDLIVIGFTSSSL